MKIIHLIPTWSLGGAERVIIELINNYPAEIQSTILTFRVFGREDNLKELVLLKSGRLRKYFSFLKYIFKNNPNILHAHMTPSIPLLIILRLLNRNIKIVYTVHNDYPRPSSKVLVLLDYLFYTKCNIKIVCVSKSTFNSFKGYLNIPPIIIYNGLSYKKIVPSQTIINEISRLKPTPTTKIFLTITRIVPQKNLELLVNAFKELERNYDVLLIIIGYDPSPDQAELTKLKRNLPENVILFGSRLNAQEYLPLADACCLSSITEPFSMSLLEALSFGVPVLSTNVGGVPEAITDNVTGFLSDGFSVDDYVKMLKRFLRLNKENVLRIKQNASEHFNDNFTANIMIARYMKVYKNG